VAYYLGLKGYSRVDVLEASASCGGQCSESIVDARKFDLGAIFADGSYRATFELLERLGGHRSRRTGGFLRAIGGRFEPPFGGPEVLAPVESALAQLDFDSGYRPLSQPGLWGLHPDLYLPFDQFVEKYDLEALSQLLLPFWTGFGYGYFSDSTTAYVLKYMNRAARQACFATGEVYFLEEGFAGLCRRLAEQVEVKLSTRVHRLERIPDGWKVHTSDGVVGAYDRVVMACDPSLLSELIPDQPEIGEMFAPVRTLDYNVILMSAEGLPGRSLIAVENLTAERQGHFLIAVRQHRDRSEYLFYSLSDGCHDAEVEGNVRADVTALGGTAGTLHDTRRWQYFQHVSSDEMANGFYDRVEQWQGSEGLYLAGQLMNHSSVERVVEYSADLVQRFFAC
jgi:hypothetical protein